MLDFNPQQDQDCYFSPNSPNIGFNYYSFDKEESIKNHTAASHIILFCLEGSMYVSCNEYVMTITKDQMIFIPKTSFVKYRTNENTQYIVISFENFADVCTKMYFSKLVNEKKYINYSMHPFPVNIHMKTFLEQIKLYSQLSNKSCTYISTLKIQEMFYILRTYYNKEDVADFLYPLIGSSFDFRNKVINNYKQINTVKEMAELLNTPLVTFKRQFTEEFGETPFNWLQSKRIGMVKYLLADTDIPLKSIILEMNFSSMPHFIRFCKKYLGNTPGEIRSLYKSY